ncbi:MAG: hypothetical protein HY547_02275 [Elusimicrobia bacterium]|nr:hypothetical protein [Elusimicrobiota bacterium]
MTLETAAKELLMVLGRSFAQVNLYGTDHPMVNQSIKESTNMLNDVLSSDTSHEEIVFFLDHDRLLVNGRFLGSIKEQGVGIRSLFQNFNLHSLAFLAGVTNEEMLTLCRLLREKIPDLKEFKIDEWLNQNQVIHIHANVAYYAKVEKNEDNLVQEIGQEQPVEGGEPSKDALANKLQQELKDSNQRLRSLLTSVISSANPNNIEAAVEGMKQELDNLAKEAGKVFLSEMARLQNEIKRLENILIKTFNGFIIIDNQGRILSVDDTTEHLLGQKLEHLSGRTVADAFEPASHYLAVSKDPGVLPVKPVSPDVNVRSNPEIMEAIANSGILIYNQNTRVVGFAGVPHELAKIKEYETYKNNLLARLLAAINKPVQSITKIINLLKASGAQSFSAEQKELLNQLAGQNNQLLMVMKSLYDYSLINANQLKVFNVAFSVYAAAHDASDPMIPWAKSQEINIITEVEKNLPHVQGDPRRTTEVIRHLLSNAIKNSAPQTQITIKASWGRGELERQIVVSIKDQGKGFPKGEIDKFYREFTVGIQNSDNPDLGLGLTLCKSLIELQKGHFWGSPGIESGAEFSFSLPVAAVAKEFKPESVAAPKQEQKLTFWQKLLKRIRG